jgi:PAS domain S-box-containing protein
VSVRDEASRDLEQAPIPSRAREIVLSTLLGDGADNVKLGIFVYDDQGAYVAVNAYAAELLGYSREELLTHRVGDFTEGTIDPAVLARTERREGVRRVRRKDGSEVTVAFVVGPTRVSTFAFSFCLVWELDPSDPRAANAS